MMMGDVVAGVEELQIDASCNNNNNYSARERIRTDDEGDALPPRVFTIFVQGCDHSHTEFSNSSRCYSFNPNCTLLPGLTTILFSFV
jgi:hypothetical protein